MKKARKESFQSVAAVYDRRRRPQDNFVGGKIHWPQKNAANTKGNLGKTLSFSTPSS